MPASTWRLDGSVATLSVAGHEISVDARQPSRGLSWRTPASSSRILNVLGVVFGDQEPLDEAGVETFTRGCDLVATYSERPPRHLRAQIYWRSLTPNQFTPAAALPIHGGFDLILSVNTSVLDEDPQSSVRSIVSPAVEVLDLRADASRQLFAEPLRKVGLPVSTQTGRTASSPVGCFIVRTAGSSLSYVEMVHPTDYQQSDVLTGDGAPPRVQLAHTLFSQRLEKGVILRARVRCALVERKHDEAAAIAGYRHFSAAEPPLTA